jgi:hypothetical protein
VFLCQWTIDLPLFSSSFGLHYVIIEVGMLNGLKRRRKSKDEKSSIFFSTKAYSLSSNRTVSSLNERFIRGVCIIINGNKLIKGEYYEKICNKQKK